MLFIASCSTAADNRETKFYFINAGASNAPSEAK